MKTSSLGDVIHTLPALTDACREQPGLRVDWLVEEAYAELPLWHPAVDRVIPVAQRRWRRRPWSRLNREQWRRCRESLEQRRYDLAIDAQGLLKSAWLTRQVKTERYGYDWRSAREGIASLAYGHRIPVAPQLHAIERTRRLVAAAIGYQSPASAPDYGLAPPPGEPLVPAHRGVLLLHGSARADKLWPEQHWQDLCDLLSLAGLEVLLPWGNSRELARAKRIAGRARSASVLPAMSLSDLARCLLQVRGVVAVDTGLGHLSAALGVPTVSLYGRSDPDLVGTRGANQRHLRMDQPRPSSPAALMQGLGPERVWQCLRDLLGD